MSASAAPPLRPGELIGKQYEIEAGLGSGPVGASYTAKVGGRRVVVKMIHGPVTDAAVRARVAEKLTRIESDALCKVLEIGEHAGRTFVAMELLEGESLRKLMDDLASQKKPIGVQEACQIVSRLLEAADAAHRTGMMHRHLKPGNVVVQSKTVGPGKVMRTVRVTGLGLSELVHPGVLAENLLDKPDSRYLAPELNSPGSGGTPQADVYSAGVLFYELLTGQTPMGTYLAPSQVRDDLPKHVDDIVDIALAANAEDRYPTARDMINDIQRVFAEDTPTATAVSKKSLAAVLGAVVAVALLGAAYILVNDPVAAAHREDEALRASVVKENKLADEATVKAKTAAHPEMTYVPEGKWIAGRLHSETAAVSNPTEPLAEVRTSKAFLIDRFEASAAKGGRVATNVTFDDAAAACAAQGKRLCTADEWERACKGPEHFAYGYGDTFDAAKCGADVAKGTPAGVSEYVAGSQADCTNKYGVFDMAGGSREWTGSVHSDGPNFMVVKGGKGGSPERGSRCAYTDSKRTNLTDRTMSYRCCLGDGEVITPPAPPAPPEGAVPAPDGAAPAPQ